MMNRYQLYKYDVLRDGDNLVSRNLDYTAIFQHDGNFVVYDGGVVVWASDTEETDGVRLCMRGNGDLVILNDSGETVWHTGTESSDPAHLQLTDEGNLEVTTDNGVIWSSKDSKGEKL